MAAPTSVADEVGQNAARNLGMAQQQANTALSLGQAGYMQTPGWKSVKRDEYANHIEVERREYDAVIRFSRRGENYGDVVTEVTVPLGALEGLA